MNYYKVEKSTETGKKLIAFLQCCRKADIAADKYAKKMGAYAYIQPDDAFAGGCDILHFKSDKGKEWKELPTDDTENRCFVPNCTAIPAIKMVKKGEKVVLKFDEFIPGGEKKMKRLTFEDVKRYARTKEEQAKIADFEKANLGEGAYDFIPVFRFVDEKTLQPIQAHQRSGAATVPQWFRKAVEAERLRLSLPIVEMSEFNDIVNAAIPETREEAERMALVPTCPALFTSGDNFFLSFFCPCRAEELKEVTEQEFQYAMNTALRESEAK